MPDTKIEIQSSKEKEKAFWNTRLRNIDVFNLITQGKTIDEIEKELNLQEDTVSIIMNNDFFNKRLKKFLNKKLYDMQVRKIAYMPTAFELVKAEFEKRLSKVSNDAVFNGFLKLMAAKLGNTTISPTLVNFILTEFKEKEGGAKPILNKDFISDDEAEILRKEFEVPALNSPEDSENSKDDETKRATKDPQMDQGSQPKDKQEERD